MRGRASSTLRLMPQDRALRKRGFYPMAHQSRSVRECFNGPYFRTDAAGRSIDDLRSRARNDAELFRFGASVNVGFSSPRGKKAHYRHHCGIFRVPDPAAAAASGSPAVPDRVTAVLWPPSTGSLELGSPFSGPGFPGLRAFRPPRIPLHKRQPAIENGVTVYLETISGTAFCLAFLVLHGVPSARVHDPPCTSRPKRGTVSCVNEPERTENSPDIFALRHRPRF